MFSNKKMAILFTFAVIGAAIFASSASANSIGRCATHHVNTGKELSEAWSSENVLSDAVSIVSSAGYRHIDGDLKSWMKERVVKVKTAEAATFTDYGCDTSGGIFGAGTIYFPKGTTVMAALPAEYDISDYCGIKAHKGCEKVSTTACAVGKVNCSNPLEGCAKMYFYVKKQKPHRKHHHRRHHRRKCHCAPKPPVICKQGEVMIGNGCSPQTNNQKQECEVHSGSWNENTMICVQVGQNGVCTAQSGVVNGDNNTVNQEVKCGDTTEICVGTNVCNETPPPKEEPCGCKEEPTIKITALTDLNMIPAGRDSGPFYVSTYASEAGGTLTIDPGIGGVSSCESSTPKGSFTASVPSGASEQCVKIYAPEDADKPATMTIKVSACLGAICDTREQTFKITYPTRPE